MGKRPAAKAALGADIAHEVVVGHRVVHGDEGLRAVGVGAEVEGALWGSRIHAGLPPAGDG